MYNTIEIQDRIRDLLEACEPCTLEDILDEVRIMCNIRIQLLLPEVIKALAGMIESGEIGEYHQMRFDDPLEYAWVLKQE